MAKPKIALIGPLLPYRGGIAQYTTQLHRSLSRAADLQTFSFKKLYPLFLYPGKSDKEPGQAAYRESGVDYKLSIFSPLSWHQTAKQITRSGSQVVIINWWTLIWQPAFAYIAWRLRKQGIKTIFLCHNLYDHDATGIKRRLSVGLLRQADAYIVHSLQEATELARLKPAAQVMQRDILPVYDQFPAPSKKLPKRGRLELLFFGFIRPYKGLEILVEALAKLNDSEVYLTVLGEAWGDEAALRNKLLAFRAPNIELKFEYASEIDAANYFERADVVVLPYLTATGSAVLSLAYFYKRPVIATKVGGLPDAVKEAETGWLVAAGNSTALAAAIKRVTRKQAQAMAPALARFCASNSWDEMAKDVVTFTNKLTG